MRATAENLNVYALFLLRHWQTSQRMFTSKVPVSGHDGLSYNQFWRG